MSGEGCELVSRLIGELNSNDIVYCHWKSTRSLSAALEAEEDVDLLVPRCQRGEFRRVLALLGFKQFRPDRFAADALVEHFLLPISGEKKFVHVHAYFDLVTGGSLYKAVRLPLVEEAVAAREFRSGTWVLPANLELALLLMRKSVEAHCVLEVPFLRREWPRLQEEVRFLADRDSKSPLIWLARWCPGLRQADVDAALSALTGPYYPLALKSALRPIFACVRRWRRTTRAWACLARISRAGRFAWLYSRRQHSEMSLHGAGAVVAIVGGDASGKTTAVQEVARWLRGTVRVRQVHAGKPGPTPLTAVFWACRPLLRKLRPGDRPSTVEVRQWQGTELQAPTMLYLIRSAMIAFEQARALRRARGLADRGFLVLSDRYPASNLGGTDGPRVHPSQFQERSLLGRWIAGSEQRAYERVPAPDLVIRLHLPVELAVARNAQRATAGKAESEEFVRMRHEAIGASAFRGARVVQISAEMTLEEVQAEIREAVWRCL